ncbi:hypothetical protein N0M98_09390 [Paenibacillus doosanensis]|uniref:hypothetical protein n=1 Tax=Paenibacillus doosanensis TaxID=1229154 RepID=UPI0021802BA1|nr:hypothetical protein [Paenibacillus doosanensis]MCS7460354.1 hypothetical protein [Paenibacillus doosanensis]
MVSKTTFHQFKDLEQLADHLTRHFLQDDSKLVTPAFSVQDEKLIIDFVYDMNTASEKYLLTWQQLLNNHDDVEELIDWIKMYLDIYLDRYVR